MSESTPTRLMTTGHSSDHHDTDASVARLAALRALEPGDRLAEYLLVERIGSGGMGEVWRAVHQRLGRTVAVKVMLRQSRSAWTRFEREARLAAGLDHPNIAKLYEFSLDPPFIAMQYVEGTPLHRTQSDRIRALRDAALAVHHAHQRGVLHRDLKPDNILVDAGGNAFVLDFGLARPVDDADGHLTMTGEVVGTPAYMAPEQARGQIALMDARTDVYGLGATLYALLSGHPPFSGSSTWDTLRLVVDEEPPSPGGDRDLVTICLAAMSKDRARRYASAAEFADELTRALAREPVRARRAGLAYRLTRSVQRRPAVWSLAAALALAVAAGAAFGVVKLVDARANLARALAAEKDRSRIAAERARDLTLQGVVDAARREVRELDDSLARELDDAGLAAVRARLDGLAARLGRERSARPDEGILACLVGEVDLLRNREEDAIADFTAAIAASDGPVSRKLGALELASQGRAMARLRSGFFDQMARLFVFHDQSGYYVEDHDGKRVQEDLDRAGSAGDAYERQVLELWVRYLRAFSSADISSEYVAVRGEAEALAKRGGRRNEALYLLVGVLTPFPRSLSEVVALHTAAIDRCHGFTQAWVLRALERSSNGRKAEALADLDQSLRLKPDYAVARVMRADCRDDSPDGNAAALADLDEAVRLAPHEPMCWYYRADIRRRLGDGAGAYADYHAAITRAQAMTGFRAGSALWSGLGGFHHQLGQDARAIEAYRAAAALGDNDARLTAARLIADGGDDAAALREASTLLADGDIPRGGERTRCAARVWRAGISEAAGDQSAALADLDWVIAHVPAYVPARTARAGVLRRLGRGDDAAAAMDGAVDAVRAWAAQAKAAGMADVGRHVADALVARARARADAGDRERALADCQDALTATPTHVDALRLRASLYRDASRGGDADADDAAAIRALTEEADHLRERGDVGDALARYQQALAIGDDDAARAGAAAAKQVRARAAATVPAE